MTNKEKQEKTARLIDGNWLYKKDNTEYMLFISGTKCTFQIFENNIKKITDEFYHKTAWLGSELVFTDKRKYFARFANEKKLVFGERDAKNDGFLLWEYEFKRVNYKLKT